MCAWVEMIDRAAIEPSGSKDRGMSELESSPNILAVGARLANHRRNGGEATAEIAEVNSANAAMNVMRAMKFDLLAVGNEIENRKPWAFIQQMRAAWPRQKWVYVADV